MSIWRHTSPLSALALAFLLSLPVLATAAEDVEAEFDAGNWGTELKLGFNLLQSYYTDNWNGGDKGSVVWTGTLDGLAKKKLGESWESTNTMHLAFGQNHQQERAADGELYWPRPDKSTDEIAFESLLRYTKSVLEPFVSARFESQFLDQTDPRHEFSLNPLEFYETAGISRQLIKNDERQLLGRLGFTLHQSMRDIYLADTDMVVDEMTNDGGIELAFDYRSKYFDDKVDYIGELRFYQPIYYSAKSDFEDLDFENAVDPDGNPIDLDGDLADYTTALDIDFKNTFVTNITKALNVQFMVRWVYDKYDNTVPLVLGPDDQGDLLVVENYEAVKASVRKSGQLKQTMSIGLAHTF